MKFIPSALSAPLLGATQPRLRQPFPPFPRSPERPGVPGSPPRDALPLVRAFPAPARAAQHGAGCGRAGPRLPRGAAPAVSAGRGSPSGPERGQGRRGRGQPWGRAGRGLRSRVGGAAHSEHGAAGERAPRGHTGRLGCSVGRKSTETPRGLRESLWQLPRVLRSCPGPGAGPQPVRWEGDQGSCVQCSGHAPVPPPIATAEL